MSELQISAADLPQWLCIDCIHDDRDKLTIECNFCSREDYIFYAGSDTGHIDSDWITKAVIHITEQHGGKLPT